MAKLNEVCSESNALNFFYICTSGFFWFWFGFFYDGDDWLCFKNLAEVRIAARES